MNSRIALLILLLAGFCQTALPAEELALAPAPFVTASNPPPIQMLIPGFTVRELPLNLNNLNCFAYAPDGRLFALGYDGNVFQLKDTDGDGLEDTATYFYKNDHNEIPESIGMAWGPGGLYIASKTRIIRLKDRGDGTGELETVNSNWVPATFSGKSGLDAMGIAVDANGAIYFGIACDDWIDEYRVDPKTGLPGYDVHNERGTIAKLSPDWKTRETFATGVRFTVSMAFNANGDLFCTDQEGATWLPNGNPFDELLQIQPGRHYGWPPRHPKYLPNVIDEPSVFDYAPQHQSTCGLHFDEPVVRDAKIFGPAWWRSDALIAGESRGKIFRTKLVKTAEGYVAQNSIIACLKMLTIDATPTPQGNLLVTCHSGDPDWGTGPQGKGKLFKISYTGTDEPQPVFAYAANPGEKRIVFDRPIDPAQFKNLAKQAQVTMGRYVVAGERFETFHPSYQAVVDQRAVPRYSLPILSAGITPDNRTIVLQTLPRTEAVNYAIQLPEGARTNRVSDTNRHELPQLTGLDVMCDLTGVETTWRAAGKKNAASTWFGWLPHLDLNVARGFTAASQEHARLFELLKKPGTLELRAQLDLWSMLHPAIQPGAKLDYTYPPETVTVIITSHAALNVKGNTNIVRVSRHEFNITGTFAQYQWLPLDISLPTGKGGTDLEISWFTDEDPRPRAFPLRRILLPWATRESDATQATGPRVIPEIAGGDWERGRAVFFGDKASCSKCHQVGGQGGKIGPDLSNLFYRDYDSVLRDITQPSAAINPDYVAYNIELKNGESATGVIVENTATSVVLVQATGKKLTLQKSDITGIKASSLSLMPEGLLQSLNAQQQRDLMTFLLTAKPGAKTQ